MRMNIIIQLSSNQQKENYTVTYTVLKTSEHPENLLKNEEEGFTIQITKP